MTSALGLKADGSITEITEGTLDLPRSATFPVSPSLGQSFVLSDSGSPNYGHLFVYNGTSWTDVSAAGTVTDYTVRQRAWLFG